jgi:hypothetical protein
MTFEQLKNYIYARNEIEFVYHGKKYSITYWYPDGKEDNAYISFCEFYKDTTEVKTAEELWNDVSRDGITVGEMLSGVKQEDVYIF